MSVSLKNARGRVCELSMRSAVGIVAALWLAGSFAACGESEKGVGEDCTTGEREVELCENGDEVTRTCVEGAWVHEGVCSGDDGTGDCAGHSDGEVHVACGRNGRGVRTLTCEDGEVIRSGGCDDNDVCDADALRENVPCGGIFGATTTVCEREDAQDTDSPYIWHASTCEVRQVALGGENGCAITYEDRVVCWGDNANGQLGRGDTNPAEGPLASREVLVAADTPLKNVEKVSVGVGFACAMTQRDGDEGGEVYCWGRHLQNGQGSTKHFATKVNLVGPATDLASGEGHSCVIVQRDDEKSVYCWGTNGDGQLGNGSTSSSSTAGEVELPADFEVKDLRLAYFQSCAIAEAATEYGPRDIACWGLNKRLTAGLPGEGQRVLEPMVLPYAGLGESPLAMTSRNLCVLTAAPLGPVQQQYVKLGCIGEASAAHPDADGGSDHSDYYASVYFESDFSPGLEDWPTPLRILGNGSGGSTPPANICVLDRRDKDPDQHLWCWGANAEGSLGRGFEDEDEGTLGELAEPQMVQLEDDPSTYLDDVQTFAVGPYQVCAITGEGRLYCTGQGMSGTGRMGEMR